MKVMQNRHTLPRAAAFYPLQEGPEIRIILFSAKAFVYSPLVSGIQAKTMGNNLTEAGRMAAEIKAKKRAEALRANLKRRKESENARENKGEENAKPENSK
ncbi:MAG: hypothetical protein DI626_07135 [Micavibrio aeruginosavorus]|uniref:Uncharacterized protein n=1 Tax=Micavibrio aeruginosavorus TaxID=349221 RepID=A0A2W5BVV7_9BACT|nr:MAG: hypothetical protein DI626_07135 [Micavibrio aeruginosavorus]